MTPADSPTVFVMDDHAAEGASMQGCKHGLNDWPDLVPFAGQTSPRGEPAH
jgi:hypothetical protein